MTPSWYDVLDVDPSASPEEIRAAWKDSIAELEPSDRRFKRRSSAAEVLLDPDRRAAHDAELAADADRADQTEDEGEDRPAPAAVSLQKPPAREKRVREPRAPRAPRTPRASRRRARLWLVPAVLAVVAVLLLATTAVALTRGSDGRPLPTDAEVAAARSAAESAVVPVLSYDYRRLADDKAAAQQFLTPSFREQYDQYFSAAVEGNAPRLKAIVNVQLLSSGVVRTGPGQVDVLTFVNRPSRNAERVSITRDSVVLRMVDRGDEWLLDCLITSAGGSCED